MWRSLFVALGVSSCLLGVECLMIDKAVLHTRPTTSGGMLGSVPVGRPHEVVPPDWAPWSLLAGGAVTVLYSFTIPQRVKAH
ncbi:MAG TPA: hypothetical protein VG713_15470 [Pirellulales bacterium]|nr:hypothetical protein [Pirellulales bacterium]